MSYPLSDKTRNILLANAKDYYARAEEQRVLAERVIYPYDDKKHLEQVYAARLRVLEMADHWEVLARHLEMMCSRMTKR